MLGGKRRYALYKIISEIVVILRRRHNISGIQTI